MLTTHGGIIQGLKLRKSSELDRWRSRAQGEIAFASVLTDGGFTVLSCVRRFSDEGLSFREKSLSGCI